MVDQQAKEVEANYDFFRRRLNSFLEKHRGEYVLLKNCEVQGFYSSAAAAYAAGLEEIEDRVFSIQEVTDEPIDLGFFSHAGH